MGDNHVDAVIAEIDGKVRAVVSASFGRIKDDTKLEAIEHIVSAQMDKVGMGDLRTVISSAIIRHLTQ